MKTRIQNTLLGLSALTAAAIGAPIASGAIVGVTGQTTWLLSPPASCTLGSLGGITAFAWDEKQNVALSLSVDMVNNPGSSTSPIPGSVNGNFDSHFVHFDGVAGIPNVVGTVTFATPIVAVIFRNLNLDNSDGPAGAPATIYPTGYPLRGLSSVPLSFISINANVLSFNLSTVIPSQFVNQVRVLTTPTPTPGSAALLGVAAVTVGFRRRR